MPYVLALNWSVAPLLMYAAFRRYLQSVHKPGIVTFALVSANLVNVVGNAWLIPHFGVVGTGWATLGSRIYMAAVLVVYAFWADRGLFRAIPAPAWAPIRQLLVLGGPVALHWLLEIGVFATTTVLAARLAPEALAAHHITLMIVATTFMVPAGLSTAGAVVVGHSIGAADLVMAKRTGWITIGLAVLFMSCSALMLFLFPRALGGLFTQDVNVLALVVPLLYVSGVFQIFDGTQVTAAGVLRGAGDTQTTMYVNLVAHWGLGLPAGYFLCFVLGWGVVGLWTGLSAGLIVVAVVLLWWWARYSPRSVLTHN
jgi:MATE family multidrug resistance protein